MVVIVAPIAGVVARPEFLARGRDHDRGAVIAVLMRHGRKPATGGV